MCYFVFSQSVWEVGENPPPKERTLRKKKKKRGTLYLLAFVTGISAPFGMSSFPFTFQEKTKLIQAPFTFQISSKPHLINLTVKSKQSSSTTSSSSISTFFRLLCWERTRNVVLKVYFESTWSVLFVKKNDSQPGLHW